LPNSEEFQYALVPWLRLESIHFACLAGL